MDTDNLLAQLNKNDEWIHNADTKLSIILAFIVAFAGLVIANSNIIPLSIFIITLLLIIMSTFYALRGINANITNKKTGLWFFGDVARFEHHHSFGKLKRKQTKEQLEEDLIIQIHTTAKIAANKFKNYKLSLNYTVISVIVFSVAYLFKLLF